MKMLTCWAAALTLFCGAATADAGLFGLFGKHKSCCQDECCPEECCPEPTCCAPEECCEDPSCCAPECCPDECGSTSHCGKKKGILSKLLGCFKKKKGCCGDDCCPE